MSIALEIIAEDGSSIDLDPWCHYAKVSGRKLIGNMRFGTEIIGTDSPEIVAIKRKEAGDQCDIFLETVEPYVGKIVTIIYEATKIALVKIPEDFGLSLNGDKIEWELAENISAPATKKEVYVEPLENNEFLFSVKSLEAAIRELIEAIRGNRKK